MLDSAALAWQKSLVGARGPAALTPGAAPRRAAAGQDATEGFEDVGHSQDAIKQLEVHSQNAQKEFQKDKRWQSHGGALMPSRVG